MLTLLTCGNKSCQASAVLVNAARLVRHASNRAEVFQREASEVLAYMARAGGRSESVDTQGLVDLLADLERQMDAVRKVHDAAQSQLDALLRSEVSSDEAVLASCRECLLANAPPYEGDERDRDTALARFLNRRNVAPAPRRKMAA